MKELLRIFENPKIKEVLKEYAKTSSSRDDYAFNIFQLSSYGTQLENFHSDIIAALLDPIAEHNEGAVFLNSFLNYLNKYYDANINLQEFKHVKVEREKGRLDILIKDEVTENAIIIENKINHAPDMDNQLERYYNWCIDEKYNVKAVIYLTLTGEKTAPLIEIEDSVKPINIAAFTNTENDLVNGWISHSIGLCNTIDASSLLIQYKKLIIYLGYNKMNTEQLNTLYAESDNLDLVKKVNQLKDLTDGIPEYRMDLFVDKLQDFKPFKKSGRYKPYLNHMVYENFIEDKINYKMDIEFNEEGDAFMFFWAPDINDFEKRLDTLQSKLQQIGYKNEMKRQDDFSEWVGYKKCFSFEDFNSMKEVDDAIFAFVKGFLEALKKS